MIKLQGFTEEELDNLESSLIDEAKQRKRKNTDENYSKLQTQTEIDEDIDDIFGQTSEGRPFGHKDDIIDQYTDENSSRMTDDFTNKNENFESAKKSRYDDANKQKTSPKKVGIVEEARKRKAIHDSNISKDQSPIKVSQKSKKVHFHEKKNFLKMQYNIFQF